MYKKNLWLKLLPLTLTPFLVSATISCSCVKTENVVYLSLPFSVKDRRSLQIRSLVNRFNREALLKDPNHKSILLTFVSNSREELFTQLALQIKVNDPLLPSLVFYYPSAAFLVNSYERAIDFSEEIESANIIDKFMKTNEYIDKSPLKQHKYVIPLASSTDMLVVNKLNLGYVLFKLQEFINKHHINKKLFDLNNSSLISSTVQKYIDLDNNLKQAIERFWNLDLNENFIEAINSLQLEYNDDIFKYNESLLNIVSDFSKLFSKIREQKILYAKHPTNLIYNLAFNYNNGSYDDFLLTYKDNGLIDYKKIYNPNTTQYQSIKYAFDQINDSLKKQALYIDAKLTDSNRSIPPASYDTIFSLTTNNAYEWIIGHNKYNDRDSVLSKDDFFFFNAPTKNNANQEHETFITQGINIIGIKHNEEKDKVVKKFVKWMYDQNNKINWNDIGQNDPMLESLTPAQYYSYINNYIFPSDDYIAEYKNINPDKINISNSNYIDNIEKLSSNQAVLFEEPVDHLTDSFRQKIKTAVKQLFLNNTNDYDFDWFIHSLENQI